MLMKREGLSWLVEQEEGGSTKGMNYVLGNCWGQLNQLP